MVYQYPIWAVGLSLAIVAVIGTIPLEFGVRYFVSPAAHDRSNVAPAQTAGTGPRRVNAKVIVLPVSDRTVRRRTSSSLEQRAAATVKGGLMRRFLVAMLGLPIGYLLFAFAGYWAIELLSGNAFDRSVEASMTTIFAIGPTGAIVGFIAGLALGGRK
jgi:hypothetical protein